ncbi:MAG: polysaccharide biosynthesis tyrosine autokinase [Oscillochloridaceae bacterium]|nr:polysaccharide biosynthesis tyrosine autokinase [Chloroflexaceae bacterium]MDW8391888.1 polysaccharide biosynthesis tyrosine autokinase [Oscillochloridaceae bacterium]
MKLASLLQHLLQREWLIVLSAVMAGVAALLASHQLPAIYSATTTVLISNHPQGADIAPPTGRNDLLVESYIQLLKRQPLLDAIRTRLTLNTRPERLARQLQAKPVPGTQLITISARAGSAEQAAILANTAAAELGSLGPQMLEPLWRRTTVTIVAPATPPVRPIFPRTPLNVALAAVIGGLTATGLIILRKVTSTVIETPENVGLDTLASVPRSRNRQHQLVTLERPETPAAEAYRQLRARLRPALPADGPWALAVTSAVAAEGKSVVAANLAIALARAGSRVILVDAHLRRPALHTMFDRQGSRGLTTALRQKGEDIVEHLLTTDVPNLRLLAAGPPANAPADLLASRDLPLVIARLKELSDIVILDCGPALAVADGLDAARASDAVLLTARAGATRKSDLEQVYQSLERTGTQVLGVVLTNAPPRPFLRPATAIGEQRQPIAVRSSDPGQQPAGD